MLTKPPDDDELELEELDEELELEEELELDEELELALVELEEELELLEEELLPPSSWQSVMVAVGLSPSP